MEQDNNTIDYLQEVKKLKGNTQQFQSNHPCPACGYCPHCGRGGYRTIPIYPVYPTYPMNPDWTWRPEYGPTYSLGNTIGDQVI